MLLPAPCWVCEVSRPLLGRACCVCCVQNSLFITPASLKCVLFPCSWEAGHGNRGRSCFGGGVSCSGCQWGQVGWANLLRWGHQATEGIPLRTIKGYHTLDSSFCRVNCCVPGNLLCRVGSYASSLLGSFLCAQMHNSDCKPLPESSDKIKTAVRCH